MTFWIFVYCFEYQNNWNLISQNWFIGSGVCNDDAYWPEQFVFEGLKIVINVGVNTSRFILFSLVYNFKKIKCKQIEKYQIHSHNRVWKTYSASFAS